MREVGGHLHLPGSSGGAEGCRGEGPTGEVAAGEAGCLGQLRSAPALGSQWEYGGRGTTRPPTKDS